jgi:hypothetical protein
MWKLAAALAACVSIAHAQERAGQVVFALGEAQRITPQGKVTALARGDAVFEGDTVRTGADSHVQLRMVDEGRIAVRPDSELRVKRYREELAFLELVRGAFRSLTGKIGLYDKARYRIESSRVVLGIRGTDHETHLRVSGADAGTYNRVSAGGTYLQTPQGRVDLEAGQSGFAPLGAEGAPVLLPATPAFMLASLPPARPNSGPALREGSPGDEQRLQMPEPPPRAGASAHSNGRGPGSSGEVRGGAPERPRPPARSGR